MHASTIPAGLIAVSILGVSHSVLAAPQDGLALQRMCQGADKVKALSVMCHSYLNGFLDTVAVLEKQPAGYCIAEGDKARMPGEVTRWLGTHSESLKEPAPLLLKRALAESFPCKRGK